MSRTPRTLTPEPEEKKPSRGRKPRALAAPVPNTMPLFPTLKPAEWRYVVFTDLHVGARTIDRALVLLERVRETAKHFKCGVICLGDFWDQRAALSVRHLDLIQREFEKGGEEGVKYIIVPGNHDQVTLAGDVNAVRIFDAFEHVSVATEPFVDPEKRIAFLPWREVPAEQAEMFSKLEGSGWTIFAHAEAQGAIANSGKAAHGRVTLAALDAHRAVYLGHYHKRQKLGAHTWYIGSPFEMNMGERDEPHGIALVDSEDVEPCFLDLDDFPKHARLTWPEDATKLAALREQDIAEVFFKPEDLHGPTLTSALANVKAKDVRPLPLALKASGTPSAPPLALTLGEAIRLYVEEYDRAQTALGSPLEPERRDHLVSMGRRYLMQVPDARTIVPVSPYVRILGVRVKNFCAIRGDFTMDLTNLGAALLRGPMTTGKTSICDAITWAFYNATTPRKPGDRAGSLQADSVIHDDADEATVRVEVSFDPPEAEEINVITIERTRKRGQAAKLRVSGVDAIHELNGISDTQDIVNRIIGLDLDLYRATVYLGQGEVANFVTDADKRRKDLLARAFGLGACAPAQKLVRDEIKRAEGDANLSRVREHEAQAALAALTVSDFATQAAQWEQQKVVALEQIVKTVTESEAMIAQIAPHLESEGQWNTTKGQYEAHINTLTKSLAASAATHPDQKIAQDLGASEAELSIVQRDLALLKKQHGEMMFARDSGQGVTCRECGQRLPDLEAHLGEHEGKIESRQMEVRALETRVLTLKAARDAQRVPSMAPDQAGTLHAIEEARSALTKCDEALRTIAGLREKSAQASRTAVEQRAAYAARAAEVNPFIEKAREIERAKEQYTSALNEAQAKLTEASRSLLDLAVWDDGFGPKGVPVLVLRTVLYELEMHANAFLSVLLNGRVTTSLVMDGEDLSLKFYEFDPVTKQQHERTFYGLSGGQRRCVELAFSPFALSEMIFARTGVRVRALVVDELTTHLDAETKPALCNLLRTIDRETVLVIDHDAGVQGEFETIYDAKRESDGTLSVKRATT